MVPTFAALVLLLHLGHILGDFLLQTDRIALGKVQPGLTGFRHAALHGAGLLLAQGGWVILGGHLLALRLSVIGGIAMFTANIGTHVLIDWNRRGPRWWCSISGSRGFYDNSEPAGERSAHSHGALHVDQALHFQITGISAMLGTLL